MYCITIKAMLQIIYNKRLTLHIGALGIVCVLFGVGLANQVLRGLKIV